MLKTPSVGRRSPVLALGLALWLFGPTSVASETPRILPEPPTPRVPAVPLEPSHAPTKEKEEIFEELIRGSYTDLVRWTEPSGKDLQIEIRKVVHIPREAFGSVFYTDVVTLPGGETVVTARQQHTASWTDEERVMYDPAWVSRERYVDSEEGRRFAAMRLDEGLRAGSRSNPSLLDVTSITTFEVRVTLGGKERTYQAAFTWIDPEPEASPHDDWDFDVIVWDHVTIGVLSTLDETAPMGDAESLPSRDQARRGGNLASKASCYSGSGSWAGSTEMDKSQYFSTDHISGAHGPFGRFAFECSCNADCSQSCSPSLSHEACQETGEVNTCHVMSFPSFAVKHGSTSDSSLNPAACEATVACAWKACDGCACGSVTAGVSYGGQLTVTSSPQDASTIALTVSHQCDVCPTDSDSDSDGGGSDEPYSDSPDNDDDTWGGFEDGCNCTPIVVNLGDGPIRLSGLDDPVQFDLDDDSLVETLSWTERGSDVAFLVHDRDGDGAIRLGAELFGAYTPQPASDDPNGFRALDLFDRAWLGGNEDGWITEDDRIFDDLMLWIDANHDAVAEDFELFTLREHGIEAIELDYAEHRWRDRHGNEFRYSSRVRFEGGRTDRIVDVILLHESP
ncbi:MAG: hypothetical protein ACOC5J_02730 [Gemmatimonadota bacterium]